MRVLQTTRMGDSQVTSMTALGR